MAQTAAPPDSGPPEDPFDAHFWREPCPRAAVDVIVLDWGGATTAPEVGQGLVALLEASGRACSLSVVSVRDCRGIGPAIERGAASSSSPLVLLTTATRPWSEGHLRPLLDAINRCDHVVGRRPGSRLIRWLLTLRWRLVFGVPVLDVHSPCTLHRREALVAIPLQSASSLAAIELLAKATFLGHLIDEVPIPEMPAPPALVDPGEVRSLFRRPRFRPRLAPAEQPEGEQKRDDRPGGQDQQRGGDVPDAGTLQDHPS